LPKPGYGFGYGWNPGKHPEGRVIFVEHTLQPFSRQVFVFNDDNVHGMKE
jgi:hypothetical protein